MGFKRMLNRWKPLLVLGLCVLTLLLTLNCGVSFTLSTLPESTSVVTQEVTRVVVATPTITLANSPEPVLTVVLPAETEPATTMPMITVEPEAQSPSIESELDDPESALQTLSAIAQDLVDQGTHTLRITVDLEVPLDLAIRNGHENLTRLVGDQLSEYEMTGDLIFDVSLDDLSQQVWVIKAIGGVSGVETEQIVEIWQDDSIIWEKDTNGEWVERELATDEAVIPLANSLLTIDDYTHAINLSDILMDTLRPLPLSRGEESPSFDEYGWGVTDDASVGAFVQARRERPLSSCNNMTSLVASLANSGISAYVNPAEVTNGIQEFSSYEEAWLLLDSWLVDHSLVRIKGSGAVEVSYLGQQRTMDGTITLETENTYQYLLSTTSILSPTQ